MLKNTETSGTSPVRRLFMLFIGSDRKVRFYNELKFSRKSYSRNRRLLLKLGFLIPINTQNGVIHAQSNVKYLRLYLYKYLFIKYLYKYNHFIFAEKIYLK